MKIKYYISLAFLALGLDGTGGFSASGSPFNTIDSLSRVLQDKRLHDTLLVSTFNELSWEYSYISPDSGIYFARQAIRLSQQHGYGYGLGVAYGMAGVNSDILGRQKDAMDYYLLSLSYWESIGDKEQVRTAMHNIGTIYLSMGRDDKALEYFKKVLTINKEINNRDYGSRTLINVGNLYRKRLQADSAMLCFQQALAIQARLKEQPVLAEIYGSIANLHMEEENFGEALTYFEKALEIDNELQRLPGKANRLTNISIVYQNQGKYSEALQKGKMGLEVALKSGHSLEIRNGYLNLSDIYDKIQDYKTSIKYLRRFNQIDDSIKDLNISRQIFDIEAKYQNEKKEKEIILLQADNKVQSVEIEKKREERKYLIAGMGFIFIIALLLIRQYHQKQGHNNLLVEKNLIIEKALAEKELLLKEIHHRVKNNLQIVSSLLFLQSKHIKDKQALQAVKDGRNRVKSMALIHQKLYQGKELTGINFQEYIDNLVNSLYHSYCIEKDRVVLNADIEEMQLDLETMVPLGLIVNELISNALKHAFPDNRKGVLSLSLRQEERTRTLDLKVEDNGIGIPKGYNIGQSGSFGLKLVQSLLQKLKATIYFDNKGGTVINICIKAYKLT